MSYDHTTVPKAHPMDSIRVATMLVWQYFLVGTTCLHRKTEFLAPDSRIEALSHRIKYVVNPKTHGIPQSSQGPQGCNIQVPSDRGGGGGGEGRGGQRELSLSPNIAAGWASSASWPQWKRQQYFLEVES